MTAYRVSDLPKLTERNLYGDLILDKKAAIAAAYPEIKFVYREPGKFGGNPDCRVYQREEDGQWILSVPEGLYRGSAGNNIADWSIKFIESSRRKLNLAGCPLFVISGRQYAGRFTGLSLTYFLFGKNEDGSFFCHKVRPAAVKQAIEQDSLDPIRHWIWHVKKGEKIVARQGDLAFINFGKEHPGGELTGEEGVAIGNHVVMATAVHRTRYRVFVLNPVARHHEHISVSLTGWFELRLAKVWKGSRAD